MAYINKLLHNKKVIYSIIIIGILIIFIIGISLPKGNNLVIKNKDIQVEFGNIVSNDVTRYLDLTKVTKSQKEKIIKNSKISCTTDFNHPTIGNHEITIEYQKEKVIIKVEVKDTIKPKFNDINEITFEVEQIFKYEEAIKAEDLQEVTYIFDDSKVDRSKAGEYLLKVSAKDKSNNEAIKDIKVIVTAKVVEERPSRNVDNNTGPTSNSGSKPSNSPSSGGGGQGGNVSTPPEIAHEHVNAAFGKYFTTDAQADAWAVAYLTGDENFNGNKYHGYGVHYCSCGLISLSFY